MKKIITAVMLVSSLAVAPVAPAFDLTFPIVFTAGYLAGKSANNEPHWSFRDGCTVQSVKVEAAGGGYSYASYDHCKSLPRVYGGKAWAPTQSKATSPSA